MPIYRMKQYSDGGPNDKGTLIGYVDGESEQEIRNKLEIHHGFIQFFLISNEEYYNEKKEMLNSFNSIYSI